MKKKKKVSVRKKVSGSSKKAPKKSKDRVQFVVAKPGKYEAGDLVEVISSVSFVGTCLVLVSYSCNYGMGFGGYVLDSELGALEDRMMVFMTHHAVGGTVPDTYVRNLGKIY